VQDLGADFQGFLDGFSVHDGGAFFLGDQSQAGQGEDIDFSHDPACSLADEEVGLLGEDFLGRAGDFHAVAQVGVHAAHIQGLQGDSHRQARGQGGQDVSLEDLPELGEAHEDEGEEGPGVPLVVEEDVEMLQDREGEEMGLVQDQDGVDLLARGHLLDMGLDSPEEGGCRGLGFEAEGGGELAVEIPAADLGVVDVGHPETAGIECSFQGAQEEGLSGAGISGEDGRGPALHGGLEGRQVFLCRRGEEEVGEIHLPGEGEASQAEAAEDLTHGPDPPRRRLRGPRPFRGGGAA